MIDPYFPESIWSIEDFIKAHPNLFQARDGNRKRVVQQPLLPTPSSYIEKNTLKAEKAIIGQSKGFKGYPITNPDNSHSFGGKIYE